MRLGLPAALHRGQCHHEIELLPMPDQSLGNWAGISANDKPMT
jgi:hypothetical protein